MKGARGLRTYFLLSALGGLLAVALPGMASGTTGAAARGAYPAKRIRVSAASIVNFRQLAHLEAMQGRSGPARPAVMPEPQEIPEPNMRQLTLPSPFGSQLLSAATRASVPSPSPAQSFLAQSDSPRPSGYSFIPPDTDGAVGTTKLMSTLNSNYVIEQKSNGAVLSSVGMDNFWASVGATGPFDPKTYYDPYNSRWIVAAVDGAQSASSAVLYGISASSDPSGSWYLYRLDADAGNANWADYPGVGFNKNALAITVNMFTNASNAYANVAKVFVVNYPALVGHLAAAAAPTEIDVPYGFTIQPAVTYSPTENTLYMVEHGASSSGTYYFYALNGTTLTGGASAFTNPLGGWTLPGSANVLPQLGGHSMDSGDSRILNAVYRNGNIYYAQTIGLGGVAGSPARTGAQWVELNTGGNFVQGGRIVDSAATSANGGHWYAYPSIAVNKNNDVIVGFSEFQSNDYADAGYAVHLAGDATGTMRDPVTLKDGEGNYFKTFSGPTGRNRWGDYSMAEVDPSDDTGLWLSEEYAQPTPGGCSTSAPVTCGKWGTWWGRVVPGSSPPPPPPASYTLSVGKTGTAAGAGVVSGSRISCGTTCSASYTAGTIVTLTESHNASNTAFAGWGGACSGVGSTCTVTLNGNESVVATFNQRQVPAVCIVPKVIGKKLRIAKTKIIAAHCKVGRVSYAKSKKKKKGRVIRERPAAGTHRANGAKVSLVVGRGPKR